MPARPPRLLYLVTEDWYFHSHRLSLAAAAQKAGYDVAVVTRVQTHGEAIRSAGLRLFPLQWTRKSRNPLRELRAIREIAAVYAAWQPDLVHHVAIKPVLYGSIAAHLQGVPVTVNAIAGLGYLFTAANWKARLLRRLAFPFYRWALRRRGSRVIVQNPDDRALLVDQGFVQPEHISLVRGAGVDLSLMRPLPEPQGRPLVVLPARMLKEKGVLDFIEAARRLQGRAQFALLGDIDADNPNSLSAEELRRHVQQGFVQWHGWVEDMAAAFAQCHIVCLPSYYGEGIPKSLIEAAACGRPIVTCDTPGCRETVREGVNGFLVPPRDPATLADKLTLLIDNAALRKTMGQASRAMAEKDFSLDAVIEQTLFIYAQALASKTA